MCNRPRRRPDVNWIEIDGDIVATDPANGAIHVLRGSAAALWQLIDGEPLDGFGELIAETFGIDAEVADADIDLAFQLLSATGLIDDRDRSGGRD